MDVGFDGPLAHVVVPGADGDGGLKARAEVPRRDSIGQGGLGGCAADLAAESMQFILDHLGLDLGEFDDLMPPRRRALPPELLAAA
jgi:hypothetical protein